MSKYDKNTIVKNNREFEMIKLRMLGCNGGIGGPGRRTTCYAIDDNILIDAGTGVGELDLQQLSRIDHVLLTHAHIDHIACLPLLTDAVTAIRNETLQVWALPAVIDILVKHVFNDLVWPDFTKIPSASKPFITLNALPESGPLQLGDLRFSPLAANHGIPACGYRVEKNQVSLAFSGDTADCPPFWSALEQDAQLAAVILECSYPRRMVDMAKISRHFDVDSVAHRLRGLPEKVASIVVHRKPGMEEEIEEELKQALTGRDVRFPVHGQVYEF